MINIDNLIKGKKLPMDYDELVILSGEIERAVLAKAMPIPKQEPAVAAPDADSTKKLWDLFKKTDWDAIAKTLDFAKSVAQNNSDTNQSPRITEQETVLDKPARVNATNFMAGVPARMVVEAAQRYYEYRQENTPEKDSELQQKFFAAIDSIKKPVISQDQLLEIAISAISSVQSFSGLASPHAQRWLEDEGRALLNKLNANAVAEVRKEPVSQDREMLITLMSAFDTEHSICENCGHQEETMYMDSANILRDYLQSNPVPAQAAAIPDAYEINTLEHTKSKIYKQGWNDCRSAMLSAYPKPE